MGRKFYGDLPYRDIPFNEDSAARWLEFMREDGVLLVAEVDGLVVGMAGGVFSQFIFNDEFRVGAELMFWIEPLFRAEGIGVRLLEALEKAAQTAGCVRWSMIAVCDGSQDRVGKLYERHGYTLSEHTYTKRP
jgi:GNAT superfamily N-acetyltransferase